MNRMRRAALFVTALLALGREASAACALPKGASLRIGCTVGCDSTYVAALKDAAQSLGYRDDQVLISTIAPPADGDYAAALSGYDAILSPGGHDIQPRYYDSKAPEMKAGLEERFRLFANGGEDSPDFNKPKYAARDQHESALMKAYFSGPGSKAKPLLGVCYGMQMFSAAHGIPMYVDIASELAIPPRKSSDVVTFVPGSVDDELERALGRSFKATENHHQAVHLKFLQDHPRLFPDVKVLATSNGGRILEILEATDRPALGIQFHAERSSPEISRAVYGWLLTQACEARARRQ